MLVYVLSLENNKIYVGRTSDSSVTRRLSKHSAGEGAAWTRKYKPLGVLEVIPNCDRWDEDKFVIKYMSTYGVNNVRGGSFSQVSLPDTTLKVLSTMCRGSSDTCFRCGLAGHFAADCTGGHTVSRYDNIPKVLVTIVILIFTVVLLQIVIG